MGGRQRQRKCVSGVQTSEAAARDTCYQRGKWAVLKDSATYQDTYARRFLSSDLIIWCSCTSTRASPIASTSLMSPMSLFAVVTTGRISLVQRSKPLDLLWICSVHVIFHIYFSRSKNFQQFILRQISFVYRININVNCFKFNSFQFLLFKFLLFKCWYINLTKNY